MSKSEQNRADFGSKAVVQFACRRCGSLSRVLPSANDITNTCLHSFLRNVESRELTNSPMDDQKSPHLNGILSHEMSQLAAALAARCAHQSIRFTPYVIKTTQPRQLGCPHRLHTTPWALQAGIPPPFRNSNLGSNSNKLSAQPIITNGVIPAVVASFCICPLSERPSGGWRPLTHVRRFNQFS